MPRNGLPRVTKHYSPTGRRNHGRPLKYIYVRIHKLLCCVTIDYMISNKDIYLFQSQMFIDSEITTNTNVINE